jgi:maltose alpha-D-glucosyltransferase/alpha-amylase
MFLRNHDELTLEMVTDEERDYMYQEYAVDPRMRLNLGIRRRLAPLLENDRRKIELLNSILFTMPGAPIVYYGDEIGMGDNIFLGDRDGVRTPMQWSLDRNGGFSRAEPQRLYLPVINDSVYGYQAVNVEAQQLSPFSLLNWMKRLIQVRKAHRAFGRGSIEFLLPDNEHVLAYLRKYEGDVVLLVHNLSASAQPARLDLNEYQGTVPVELLGQTEFMPIQAAPYPLTLSPYGFYWFVLRHPVKPTALSADTDLAGRLREWGDEDAGFLANRDNVVRMLAGLSPGWLQQQRWFRSKSREMTKLELLDYGVAPSSEGASVLLAVLRVQYREGPSDSYLLPLSLRPPLRPSEEEPPPILSMATATRDVGLYDAMYDPAGASALLRLAETDGVVTGTGAFRGRRTRAWSRLTGDREPVRIHPGEQSNTSVVMGEAAILKVFRKLEPGLNPDIEISRYLVEETEFQALAALAGWIEYTAPDGTATSLAGCFEYIPNRGDAWDYTLTTLVRFLSAASRSAADPSTAAGDAALRRMTGGYFDAIAAIGRVTAEMHLALASAGPDQPDFVPEPILSEEVQRWIEMDQRAAATTLADAARQLRTIPKAFPAHLKERLAAVVREGPDLRQRLEDCRFLAATNTRKCRIHGDYHLGQVLRAKDPSRIGEWVVLDFEGEPQRPLAERREKQSPLRDLAGMLRSFNYAVQIALREFATDDLRVMNSLLAWSWQWERTVRSTFLESYREAAGDAGFLPADPDVFDRVLGAFELAKALYELNYEINNRPDWIGIPLQGILEMEGRWR